MLSNNRYQQWDSPPLYLFCRILCNCNNQYLDFLGMCNATCLLIVQGNNIAVDMEFAVSCCNMIRRLK